MTITTTAIYSGGLLLPIQPLTLTEGETVELRISSTSVPELSENELIHNIQACKNYHEWLELSRLLPSDDGGYDIVKALDENRRWSGERPLAPTDHE